MSILYKHYGNGIGDNYLENPTFLLSTPNDLNDPFESNIAKDIMNIIMNGYSEQEKSLINSTVFIPVVGLVKRVALSTVRGLDLKNELNRQSIISLTETNRDILMWAHYSDKHQGCVIGYDLDLITENIKEKHQEYDTFTLEPKVYKVNYRSIRFDPDIELNEQNIKKELLRLITTTKSDHWIYEKEHRLIIPLGCADTIRLLPMDYHGKKDQQEFDKMASSAINPSLTKDIIKYDRYTDITINNGSKVSDVESYIHKLRNYYKVMPLISIPKESIKTIHFGSRSGNSRIAPPLKIINKTPEYKSVKAFEYIVSNERFELIPQQLSHDMFNVDRIDSLFDSAESNMKPAGEEH